MGILTTAFTPVKSAHAVRPDITRSPFRTFTRAEGSAKLSRNGRIDIAYGSSLGDELHEEIVDGWTGRSWRRIGSSSNNAGLELRVGVFAHHHYMDEDSKGIGERSRNRSSFDNNSNLYTSCIGFRQVIPSISYRTFLIRAERLAAVLVLMDPLRSLYAYHINSALTIPTVTIPKPFQYTARGPAAPALALALVVTT